MSLLAIFGACNDGEPTGSSDSSTAAASSGASTTDESSTGATESAPTGSTTADTSSTLPGEAEGGCTPEECGVPFPPVMCGEAMCTVGQICMQPGLRCNYDIDPPEFYTPEPECKDVPDGCTALDVMLTTCLGTALCVANDHGVTSYKDGQLVCPAEALDCF